jgi:hypothetical protein
MACALSSNRTACMPTARPVDGRLGVVQEDRLRRPHAEAPAGQPVDARVGLGQPDLVGVDDEVDQLPEAVAPLLPAARADEAVAEQGGPVARAQAAEVLGQLHVEGAEVLPPDVGHEGVDLLVDQPEELAGAPVGLPLGDGPDGAAPPHVAEPLAQLARPQPQPRRPVPGHPEPGRDLQHPADVEDDRADGLSHEDRAPAPPPRTGWSRPSASGRGPAPAGPASARRPRLRPRPAAGGPCAPG